MWRSGWNKAQPSQNPKSQLKSSSKDFNSCKCDVAVFFSFIRNPQKVAERRGRGFPARSESRLQKPVRSRWNAQRKRKHLPRTLSSLSTTVNQTSKSLLVRIFFFYYYCKAGNIEIKRLLLFWQAPQERTTHSSIQTSRGGISRRR